MTFEVIVVLDIGNATDLESSLSSAEWVEVSVEESIHKQLLSAEHLSGFVHDLETTKLKSKANRKKKVCIHELAWLTALWGLRAKRPFVVRFLKWEAFRDILLDSSAFSRKRIKEATCAIIGGIDLALEIKCVSLSSGWITLNECYSKRKRGLDGGKLEKYAESLQELGKYVTLWPHIDEQLDASKLRQVQWLDQIAKEVTKTHRPKTFVLTPSTTMDEVQGKVLKREGSDCGKMVLVPDVDSQYLMDSDIDEERGVPFRTKLTASALKYPKTDKDLARLLKAAGPYKWLVQDYVPYLRRLGEWRVYFCGGSEIFTIQTEWKSSQGQVYLKFCLHETCYTLSEMREAMDRNPNWTADEIMAREHGTREERKRGMEELRSFARQTYEAMLALDRRHYTHDLLAMSVLCRLDISVIDVPGSNQLNFFVNEVEKFQSTGLFGRIGGPLHPIELLSDEIGETLERHFMEKYEVEKSRDNDEIQ